MLKTQKNSTLFIALLISALALTFSLPAYAMTRDEFLPKVTDALGYELPKESFSEYDEAITKEEALRLMLEGMGWGQAIGFMEGLYIIPDFCERNLFPEMLKAIKPEIPEVLLSRLGEKFTTEDLAPLRAWVKEAQKNISWRASYTSENTELTLIKKGIGNPSGSANGDIEKGKNEPLYIAALSVDMKKVNAQIASAVMIGAPKATLSRIAGENYGVIGGINGGYFADTKPVGILRRQGHLENGKFWPHRSAFGWDKSGETVFIDGKDVANIAGSKILDSYTEMLQAGPLLVKNGELAENTEDIDKNVLEKRHPRTLVGQSGQKIVWAVIDGRNNMHSVGTTIEETRKLCLALGLTHALNLDGGGSSSLLWQEVTLTLPGTKTEAERPIPYAILFFRPGSGVRD